MAGATTADREPDQDSRRPSAARPPGRRRRLPSRKALVITLLVVVLLGGFSVWVLYGSTWMRVEKVTASGTRVLQPEAVVEAAGIGLDAPLVTVDPAEVEARLKRELPRIGSVEVERSWPHAVGLKVTEREAALLLRKDSGYVEVDPEGVRFATVRTAPKGVPVAELRAADSPSLEQFGTGRLTRSAVRVAGALPKEVRRDTRTILVRSYDSVTLELARGRTVQWGSAERSTAKAKALTAVMKAAKGARHFDVSVPSAPSATVS